MFSWRGILVKHRENFNFISDYFVVRFTFRPCGCSDSEVNFWNYESF